MKGKLFPLWLNELLGASTEFTMCPDSQRIQQDLCLSLDSSCFLREFYSAVEHQGATLLLGGSSAAQRAFASRAGIRPAAARDNEVPL